MGSRAYRLGIQSNHKGQLSLVIPLWVEKMSTTAREENGEFCVTVLPVGPVTRLFVY